MEAREHLAMIEGQMLELEQDPGAMETLHSVFRTFHSIKGLAGFLEFHMIQEVAHEVETLLDLARNEKITVTSAVVDIVLEAADYRPSRQEDARDELHELPAVLRFVKKDASGQALTEMVDVLTTNHTSFFREPQHFDFLTKVIIPSFDKHRMNRVWSAACSTGEEPYTIAFTLTEALGPKTASTVQILATDIFTRVLTHAKNGCYDAEALRSGPRRAPPQARPQRLRRVRRSIPRQERDPRPHRLSTPQPDGGLY